MSVEQRLQRIENSLFTDLVLDIPSVSEDLYKKLQTTYDKESQRMLDDTTSKLAQVVPWRFLSKIPQRLHDKLYISLGKDQCEPNVARRIAMNFLKLYTEADKEFIDWYTQQLQL